MAIYNEILAPRIARQLQKFFGMKGGVPAKQLAGEMMAVFPLFSGAENRYLEQWSRFAQSSALAAAAGFVSGARFRNPPGSNVIVIIEKMDITIGVAGQINLFIGPISADLAASGTPYRIDARIVGTAGTLKWTAQNTTAAIVSEPGQLGVLNLLANTLWPVVSFEDQAITILPGDGVDIVTNSVNTGLSWTVFTRERLMEESELK